MTLTWTAPSTDGGSPITGYVDLKTAVQVATVMTGSTTTHQVTGLTDGTTYHFTVEAVNAVGDSVPSNTKLATPHHVPVVTSFTPTSGSTAGGTTVAITGTTLTAVTSVAFGTTPGTTVHATAMSVSVKTPAHAAGTVLVKVSTATGATATSSGDCTFGPRRRRCPKPRLRLRLPLGQPHPRAPSR